MCGEERCRTVAHRKEKLRVAARGCELIAGMPCAFKQKAGCLGDSVQKVISAHPYDLLTFHGYINRIGTKNKLNLESYLNR